VTNRGNLCKNNDIKKYSHVLSEVNIVFIMDFIVLFN